MLPEVAAPRLFSVDIHSLCSEFAAALAVLLVTVGLAHAPAYAATYALSVSSSSSHSNAIALNGATLAGNEYVFTSLASALTNFDPTGIAKVCFWLDNTAMSGTATHCESGMPYDYAGSVSSSSTSPGLPWNTAPVANGPHTITQQVTKSAGGTEVVIASFTVQNGAQGGPAYTLSVSSSASHGNAAALQGATLAGSAYIFTSPASASTNFDPTGIAKVCFWLDNTAMSGTATHCESGMPYDYAGSVSSSSTSPGVPWNTAPVANGPHTITQQVTKSAGGTEVDTAAFSVQNLAATLSASPTSIASGDSSTLTWTTSGATSASIDQGVGGVAQSGTLSVTPTATTTYTLTATGAANSATARATVYVGTAATQHYFYVATDQNLYVFDLDNSFQEVKHVNIPQAQGVRGIATAPSSHLLYLAYGGDGNVCVYSSCSIGPSATGSLLAYDLLTDKVVWTKAYSFGIDSFSITPDGTTIYMPDGEHSGDGIWYVIDAATGNVRTSIDTGKDGSHNTVVSLDGAFVFMAPAFDDYLVEASTATNTVTLDIGPTLSGNNIGVRPFTLNGKHTVALSTCRNYLGFQVSDTNTGKVLYTVPVTGFPTSGGTSIPSHGIALLPDETKLYLMDNWNAYVHVFDVSGLPSTKPTQIKNIALTAPITGTVSPCLYDCLREGWLNHSTDGHFVFVGDSGDVIDTGTDQVASTVPAIVSQVLSNTKMFLEIDWQNGLPVFTTTRYGLGYVTK